MSILIKGVRYLENLVNIYIEQNRIVYIGPEFREAQITICGHDKVALPSLVNAHTHAAMTLLRGYADDMLLQTWLADKIWPLEQKLTEEDVYWGAKLACLEMIKSGTTLFNDMYWNVPGTVRAVEEMGIRALVAMPVIDFLDPLKGKTTLKQVEELYGFVQECSPRIQFALGPHAIYTVSTETLKLLHEYSLQKKLPFHIHLSETQREIEDCVAKNKMRPVHYLKKLGILGPQTIAAHSVWLDDEELDILQENQVALVHNPVANLKLAVGNFFRYADICKRGIRICIGTDGCASNNNLDILEEIKFAALLQKWIGNDPSLLSCYEIWNIVTRNAHEILGVDAGGIAEGKLADLILVDLKQPQMVPCYDVISNLVYASNGQAVDTVICNGKILMQNRKVVGEEEIISKVAEIARRLAKE